MRRVSKKRARLNRSVKQWRLNLCIELGRCEVCQRPYHPSFLEVHELCIGACRPLALTSRFATLVVKRDCHDYLESLTIPHQLAYLFLSRPKDCDLESYYTLTKRRWPDLEEIQEWARKIAVKRSTA